MQDGGMIMSIAATGASKYHVQAGDYCFTFLKSGDLYSATYKGIMINQLFSNSIDGSLNNLYLRLFQQDGVQVVPMLGAKSHGKVQFFDRKVVWFGEMNHISYQVIFTLTEQGIWFWIVSLDGKDAEADVIYGQDVGIASTGAILSNQAYVSQYIDHQIFEHPKRGFVVCSRQNQRQPVGFPYLQQGALTKTSGYLTDGFQFFGLSYKETNEPEALYKEHLPNENYQYEFAYIGLQSERIKLNGNSRFVFYGLFRPDHPKAVTSLEFEHEVTRAWDQIEKVKATFVYQPERECLSSHIGSPVQTTSMTVAEMDRLYPKRYHEEWEGDQLLSFFTETNEHVVLKSKELLVERSHGHILMSGQNETMHEDILATTSFMNGIFNSQLVVGNTSFHKLLSNVRDPLNVKKTSGQRIYVEIDGVFRLLTIPSMFEMGMNYVRWFYKTVEGEWFIITNFTVVDKPEVQLHVCAASGTAYRYLVTNQIVMNGNEYEVPFQYQVDGQVLTFKADPASQSADIYPELSYQMKVEGANITITDEQKLASHCVPGFRFSSRT